MGRHTGLGGLPGGHHAVERHARYGGFALWITWGCCVLSWGVVQLRVQMRAAK